MIEGQFLYCLNVIIQRHAINLIITFGEQEGNISLNINMDDKMYSDFRKKGVLESRNYGT